jgi:hypothetical protein
VQTEPPYCKDKLEEEIQGSIKKIDDTRTKKGERMRSTEERGGEERTGEKRG